MAGAVMAAEPEYVHCHAYFNFLYLYVFSMRNEIRVVESTG